MSPRIVTFAVVVLLGCGPGRASDGGNDETSTSGDGDGDPGDGDGESGDGDGDGESGDGDGDGDELVCDDWEVECPDDTCQPDLGIAESCCGHGGPCLAGCEPQDAQSTEEQCAEPLYAWVGTGCDAICACEGTDCGVLYPTVGACLQAHEPTCGYIGLDTCPFETPLGPTEVAGMTPYGMRSYGFGAFGLIYGEGAVNLSIVLARDQPALGNHLFVVLISPPQTPDVLTIWGANDTPGEYQVYVSTSIWFGEGAMATMTITSLDLEGLGYQDYGLWATLDVSEGNWDLHGEFAIPGCQKLEQHLP